MKRYGSVIQLKPEAIAQYKRIHADVWPDVLQQIERSNITNYTIFLKEPENLLFSYYEYLGNDYEADMARFQHRWGDEFLLADYYLGNIISFDAVGVAAVRDSATDYRNLLDDRRIRNLAAFLYDILSEQRKHAEELRREYLLSASLIEARLKSMGDN